MWHVHHHDVIFRYKWVTEVLCMVCSGKLLWEVREYCRFAEGADHFAYWIQCVAGHLPGLGLPAGCLVQCQHCSLYFRWDEWEPSKESSHQGGGRLDPEDADWLCLHSRDSGDRRECTGKGDSSYHVVLYTCQFSNAKEHTYTQILCIVKWSVSCHISKQSATAIWDSGSPLWISKQCSQAAAVNSWAMLTSGPTPYKRNLRMSQPSAITALLCEPEGPKGIKERKRSL